MDMWNTRYTENPFYYGKMPNDFVVSSVGYLPKGKILCLAEGEGRNSVFLARSGFEVTGVDFSEKALENAKLLASENSVSVHYEQCDLGEYDLGQEQWDGVVSIFCHLPPSLRKSIHRKVVEGLKPGGVYLLEGYSPEQLALGTGGPKDPELLMSVKEIKSELEGLEFLVSEQTERIIFEGLGHNGPSAVTQIVAIKRQ